MLAHWIIGMFGASPANPHRYTKFRKLMLGLKNKGGAWTSELLILFLLHDITVFILLGPSAFAPSKEDALCYYCIFPSLRFDQTFFFWLVLSKSQHLVQPPWYPTGICVQIGYPFYRLWKPQTFVPVLLWRRQCLICLLTTNPTPPAYFPSYQWAFTSWNKTRVKVAIWVSHNLCFQAFG